MVRSGADYLRRAVRQPGYERDDLLLVAKSVAAAVGAWALAAWLLPHVTTAFAPFTALLAVRATVYRSLRDGAQYLVAVLIGVSLAAAFGNTFGVHAWTLAVLLAMALTAGRLRLLGAQRTQVAVTALFAFVSGGGRAGYLLELVAAVAVGVVLGLAVNLVLPPAVRYAPAGEGVARLASSLSGLLRQMADALGDGELARWRVGEWRQRCDQVAEDVRRARERIAQSEEKARLNPRRRLAGLDGAAPGYHGAVDVLQRVNDQIGSVLRSLGHASGDDGRRAAVRGFLVPYGGLLTAVAEAVDGFGREGDPGSGDGSELRARLDEAHARHRELADLSRRRRADGPAAAEQWPFYGTLLTDVSRMLQELDQGHPRSVVPLAG